MARTAQGRKTKFKSPRPVVAMLSTRKPAARSSSPSPLHDTAPPSPSSPLTPAGGSVAELKHAAVSLLEGAFPDTTEEEGLGVSDAASDRMPVDTSGAGEEGPRGSGGKSLKKASKTGSAAVGKAVKAVKASSKGLLSKAEPKKKATREPKESTPSIPKIKGSYKHVEGMPIKARTGYNIFCAKQSNINRAVELLKETDTNANKENTNKELRKMWLALDAKGEERKQCAASAKVDRARFDREMFAWVREHGFPEGTSWAAPRGSRADPETAAASTAPPSPCPPRREDSAAPSTPVHGSSDASAAGLSETPMEVRNLQQRLESTNAFSSAPIPTESGFDDAADESQPDGRGSSGGSQHGEDPMEDQKEKEEEGAVDLCEDDDNNDNAQVAEEEDGAPRS